MLRFRISLARSITPIWRELEISERSSLAFFGQAAALLFFDYLSDGEFRIGGQQFHIVEDDDNRAEPSTPLLIEVLTAPGQQFAFSRSCDATWTFDVEYVARVDAPEASPFCVGGEGDMPSDEFNHVENYNDYVRALTTRDAQIRQMHGDFVDEVAANHGRWFYEFGIDLVNERLRQIVPAKAATRKAK